MSGSLSNPLLMALLSGQGGTGAATPTPSGSVPLGTLPPSLANLSPDAVAMQRGNPQLPWYAVPNIFGPGPAPQGVLGAGPAGAAPGAAPGAQPPQQGPLMPPVPGF